MGAEPWFYFVPYQKEIAQALQDLRQREFAAGRYNPVIPTLLFPLGSNSPCPGPEHSSIHAAIEASAESGTRSILDMERVSAKPASRAICLLDEEELVKLYGTAKPTRQQVEANMDFFERIERGQGIYFIIYESEEPSELMLAGYSFD